MIMNNICSLLDIRPDDFTVITGSGGKTHLMHLIAMNLPGNVWLTSTTKVSEKYEKDFCSCLVKCPYPEKIPESPPSRLSFFYSNECSGGAKLKGACPHIIASELWKGGKNPVVCEADGSRNLPLKNYAVYDRPLSGFETRHIVCVSVSPLGEEASQENIHRYMLRPWHGIIGWSMICDMLFSKGGYMDIPLAEKACLVIGGINSKIKHEAALRIASVHKRIYPLGRCFMRGNFYGETEGWWHFYE